MTPLRRMKTAMPPTATFAITVTARLTAWGIPRRNGWSATMKKRRSAAARRKMSALGSSGWPCRRCARLPVTSMFPTRMRKTGRRTPPPRRPCWRTGMRRMRTLSTWSTAILWRKRQPGPATLSMGTTTTTRILRRLSSSPPRPEGKAAWERMPRCLWPPTSLLLSIIPQGQRQWRRAGDFPMTFRGRRSCPLMSCAP